MCCKLKNNYEISMKIYNIMTSYRISELNRFQVIKNKIYV